MFELKIDCYDAIDTAWSICELTGCSGPEISKQMNHNRKEYLIDDIRYSEYDCIFSGPNGQIRYTAIFKHEFLNDSSNTYVPSVVKWHIYLPFKTEEDAILWKLSKDLSLLHKDNE